MSEKHCLSSHFYYMPSSKVFLLSISSFGLFLIYWYMLQYSRSSHDQTMPASRLFLAALSNLWPFIIFNRIQSWLHNQSTPQHSNHLTWFMLKYPLQICPFLMPNISVYAAFIWAILVESILITFLQKTINQHHGIEPSQYPQPWRAFDFTHKLFVLLGLVIVTIPFFVNITDIIGG